MTTFIQCAVDSMSSNKLIIVFCKAKCQTQYNALLAHCTTLGFEWTQQQQQPEKKMLFLSFCLQLSSPLSPLVLFFRWTKHGRYECCCQWFGRLTAASRYSLLIHVLRMHHTLTTPYGCTTYRVWWCQFGGKKFNFSKNTKFTVMNGRCFSNFAIKMLLKRSRTFSTSYCHDSVAIHVRKTKFSQRQIFFSLSHVDANLLNV